MSEFYVGYQSQAPPKLARFLRPVLVSAGLVTTALALTLVFAQGPFAASSFEFDAVRDYQGDLLLWPDPTLLIGKERFLLVAPGKHGADGLVHGADGKQVRLRGKLIQRSSGRMIEIQPGSLEILGVAPAPSAPRILGHYALHGEIVDTKCFLGVMNPGNGKVHRSCAARCISGGVPPAFLVRDASGEGRLLLLTGADGRAIGPEVLDYVAEPIVIPGELVQTAAGLLLQAEPRDFHRE